jgi:Uma2 family endonuclease
MSSRPSPKRTFTEAEYLAMERGSDQKHEYYRGEIFAMGGASSAHNLIVSGFIGELRSALKGRRCHVYPSDQRVRVSDTGLYTYPDISVVCGEAELIGDPPETLLNPQVIIEVLSDSTEKYDRGDKFELYRSLSSLREYVLASQREPLAEHYVRQPDGAWLLRSLHAGDRLRLSSLACEISIDDVYEGVW